MSMFESPKQRPKKANETKNQKFNAAEPTYEPEQLALAIRKELSDLVGQSNFPSELFVNSTQIEAADIAQDVADYKAQMIELRKLDLPTYTVDMEYRTHSTPAGLGQTIPVLIKLPSLTSSASGYDNFLLALDQSGIRPQPVSYRDAHDIFVDRLSEFIVARADVGVGNSPPLTFVETNRGGETVLYAKGYFLSTGTVFGTSTPAKAFIPNGRYSFGILDLNGQPRYENAVWSVPSFDTIRLNLS